MCLYNAAWVAPRRIGYKIMRRSWHTDNDGNQLDYEFFPMYGRKPKDEKKDGYMMGQTYFRRPNSSEGTSLLSALYQDEKNSYNLKSVASRYPIGFHIIATKQDAVKYFEDNGDEFHAIIEVEYCGVLARGIDNTTGVPSGQCVVAAEMRLVREVPLKELKKNLRSKRKTKNKV